MVYAKFFFMAASMALLTACSNGGESAEKTPESTEQQGTVEETAAETEETANAEKEAAEKAEKEQAEKEKAEAEAKAEAEKPKYKLNPAFWGFEPLEGAGAEAVLVTIDDAPDKHSLEMAETLKEKDVPAIFFVNGHFLDTDEEKETLKKIYDMGFSIGNHTETHANLQEISEEQQREEILALSKTVEEVTGEKPEFFRAPQGLNTDFSRELVEKEGMLLMNWTYGYDWNQEYMDASALTEIMVNTEFLTNGANLLMHDREWTAEALSDIIDGLNEKGYSFIDPAEIEGVE